MSHDFIRAKTVMGGLKQLHPGCNRARIKGMTTPSQPAPNTSPKWNSNTKLIVGLTLVAIFAILIRQLQNMLGPLILSFVIAFLLHPVAGLLNKKLKLSWRFSTAVVFIVLVIVLAGIFTLTGFAIVQQIQNLIATVQRFIAELPQLISDLSRQTITFGPFQWDLSRFDLSSVANRLLSSAQAVLGQVGSLVGTIATGTITTLGHVVFILLIAYFLVAEVGQVREDLLRIDLPGYDVEVRRLTRELTRIWDAYLRSQLVIIILVIITYYILMTILGMRFTFGLALMAGLARFVPYLGPFITWTTAALLAYFQPGGNYFNLQPWAYALLVVILAVLVDQIFDQYVQPRLMGQTLGVHPAAILVAAIVAFQWLGIIGLVLAAPVLATATLLLRYALHKMFDLDPWPVKEADQKMKLPQERFIHRLRAWWRYFIHR
jgi:predicted PurR-regulated permease PerM